MEPVTGLDVSKGTGYERLGNLLDEVELEAIGHYHRSLVAVRRVKATVTTS